MPINGYFDAPFAISGNLQTVPDPIQGNGSVSYTEGFGVLYSTAVESGGYNFPRAQFNQLMNDVTTALQYIQRGNAAAFITSAMNGGTPYSYPQYATVLKDGVAYQSLQDSNTDTPPSSKWAVLDFTSGSRSAVPGTYLNLKFTWASATTATLTADEAVVATALNGTAYKGSSLNLSLDLATTGAGGMDSGSPPTNGNLYVYLIYNPTTFTFALLATNSGTGATIYPGAYMPSGYTASALASVLRTNGSAELDSFTQIGREVYFPPVSILSSAAGKATLGSQSVAAAVPVGAKTVSGRLIQSQTGASGTTEVVAASDSSATAAQYGGRTSAFTGTYNNLNFRLLPILTPQTIYWSSADTRANSIELSVSSYTF